MANRERIRNVTKRSFETHKQGYRVVFLLGAMSGETNRFFAMAREGVDPPHLRR